VDITTEGGEDSTEAVTKVVEADMRVEGDMVGGVDTEEEEEVDINNNREGTLIDH
jgi:hypothetical protein